LISLGEEFISVLAFFVNHSSLEGIELLMIEIVYFSQKQQFLGQLKSYHEHVTVITPSPIKADGLRLQLAKDIKADVVTIAKFTSELLALAKDDETLGTLKRKSELLLVFGILRKKYLSELGFEQFNQAYTLFSELRSFSLNLEVLSAILDEYPQEIKHAVILFDNILKMTGMMDEHGAYQYLAHLISTSETLELKDKCFVFWGFNHLNGQQIDLIKSLSIRNRIIIPLPVHLKEKFKKGDWVTWIQSSMVKEILLPLISLSPTIKWKKMNSREVALNLKKILQENDQIVLGVSKLNQDHLDIVPSNLVTYKIPCNLLELEINQFSQSLEQHLGKNIFLDELKSLLNSQVIKNFKLLKVKQLYVDAIEEISNLTDERIVLDSFLLKLLSMVVALNQPRTFYVPITKSKTSIELKDFALIDTLESGKRTIICVDERFESLQSLSSNYPENIHRMLSTIGPIKRPELDLSFKIWELHSLMTSSEVLFLMSPETLKHNLIWKKILDEVNIISQDELSQGRVLDLKDDLSSYVINKFEGNLSASKVQAFLDCPRKFYFSYVEKTVPQIQIHTDFTSQFAGVIVHQVIEEFINSKSREENLKGIVRSIVERNIIKMNLTLSHETRAQNEIAFLHRSQNGLQVLKKIEEIIGEEINWIIEKEFEFFEVEKFRGKIDCFTETDEYVFLLDFKSSSCPTNTEVENYQNMQLWIYANAARKMGVDLSRKKILLGFIVLDNPKNSRFFIDDSELLEKFNKIDFPYSVKQFKQPIAGMVDASSSLLSELTQKIKNEVVFPPQRRNLTVCDYCEVNNICTKGVI
jgi:RecB family exonuclease